MHILIKEGNLEMRLLDTALPSRRDTHGACVAQARGILSPGDFPWCQACFILSFLTDSFLKRAELSSQQ